MLNVGMIIGERYEIAGRIGAGGMADVYKAKDHKLNRFVAIKVLKQEFKDDKTFIRKFQTEAQSAAGLAHPNIVNVFDVGEEEGIYYIVMELVEGITLKEYIQKKGKLSVKEATSIAIQVSMGLEAAHNHNIIHRDVKPQNIIISTDGKVKVTDFGIARAASSNTISSNVMGSVHYSSPEQVRGGYSDSKSDIYSLGVTIYEMVTGKVPFEGDTTVAIAIKHLQEEIIPPSKYTPELPHSMEQIILKCTQKSVDRRYNTMEEVIGDLKHSLIDPDGDFVNLLPLTNDAQTVVISNNEMEQIKQRQYVSQEDSAYMQPGQGSYQKLIEDDDLDDLEDDEDEGESGGISTRLEKAMTIGGLIIGAVIIIILIVFIGRASGIFSFGSSKDDSSTKKPTYETEDKTDKTETEDTKVKVPNLLGKTVDEVKEDLNKLNIGIKYKGEEPSDEYEKGMIIYQSIEPGSMVEKNSTIEYKISSGQADLTVPDVTNQSQTAAEAALKELGLLTKIERANSTEVNIGDVISTDPSAGVTVEKGDTITVKVSTGKGDTSVEVPSVIGQTEEDAKSTLEELGLNVKVESGTSQKVGEGEVMKQSLKQGKTVDVGTSITITVNTGRNTEDTNSPDEPNGLETENTNSGNQTDNNNQTENNNQSGNDAPSGTATGTWKPSGQLGKPADYAGGKVKLELVQEVDGTTKTTTLVDGENITFPYSLKDVEGSPGVASGTIYLYEMVDDKYVPKSMYPLTFKQAE